MSPQVHIAASSRTSVTLHTLAAAVTSAIGLNALWFIFTLAGAVVFGFAPATFAAAHCVRELESGRHVQLVREFASAWRADLVRANLITLPVVGLLLVLGAHHLGAAGSGAGSLRLLTLAAMVLVTAAACWIAGIATHYDTPTSKVALVALRFTLARPFHTLLHLIVLTAVAAATAYQEVLLPLVSVGGWIYLSTWLSLRTFAENEDQLDAARQHCTPSTRSHSQHPYHVTLTETGTVR